MDLLSVGIEVGTLPVHRKDRWLLLKMSDHIFLFTGLGTATLSAIFYGVYRGKEGILHDLQDAVRYEIGPALYEALQDSDNRTIPYGIISGEAQPVHSVRVINSPHVSKQGLVQKVRRKEHKTEWSRTTRLWHDIERTISVSSATVPFKLCTSKGSVTVVEPLSAENLQLEVVYDNFEPLNTTVTDSLFQWASGEKTKGFQTIEEMLPVGTSLTGIGEISLTDDGINIGPPHSGLTYFLSRLTADGIIRQLKSGRKIWKVLSIMLAFGSGVLFAISFYYYWKKSKERQENEDFIRRIREGHTPASGDAEEPGGSNVCAVCLDQPRDVVILDCGHICVCHDCGALLTDCPVCRRRIARLVPTFHS